MTAEKRSAIKICVLNRVSRKPYELEKAYGIRAIRNRRYMNGMDVFKTVRRASTMTNGAVGQSITSRYVTEIRELLELDRRNTILEISYKVDFSIGTVTTFNTINLMRRVCARWIPKILSEDQKKQRPECCRRQVEHFEREGDGFLRRIITVDETWISCFLFLLGSGKGCDL